jgi:hypothetical protein
LTEGNDQESVEEKTEEQPAVEEKGGMLRCCCFVVFLHVIMSQKYGDEIRERPV